MATPDHVTEHFEDTTETMEVRGDFVVYEVKTRFGELIFEGQMTPIEAGLFATRLFDAATTILLRQSAAERPTPAPEADISGWADAAPKLAASA